MKNFWILVLFLLYSGYNHAQTYKKLLEQDNSWFVTSCFSGCNTDGYWTEEDTLIGGEVFRFLNGYHYNRNMCIREDTTNRQVFFWTSLDNKVVMIYDFSLNVGDTFEIANPISPLPSYQGSFQVDSIVLRNVLDGPRRHFYLSKIGGTDQTLWVEGIGSLALINTPGGLPNLNGAGELSCFFQNGQQVYEADSLPGDPCDSSLVYITSIQEYPQFDFKLYPNPSQGQMNIDLIKVQNNIQINIIDLLGRSIKQYSFVSTQNISLDLSPLKGLYVLEISLDNHPKIRKQIILQ
jgi:hypothetical protein